MSSDDRQQQQSAAAASSTTSPMSSDPLRNGAIFRLKRTDLGAIRSPGALVGQQAMSSRQQSPSLDNGNGSGVRTADRSREGPGNGSNNSSTQNSTTKPSVTSTTTSSAAASSSSSSITAEDIIKEKFDQIYRATPVPTSLLGLDAGAFGGAAGFFGNSAVIGSRPGSHPSSSHSSPAVAQGSYIGPYSSPKPPIPNTASPAGKISLAHLQQLQQQQLMHQQQVEQLRMRQHYQNIGALDQRASTAAAAAVASPSSWHSNTGYSFGSNSDAALMPPPPPAVITAAEALSIGAVLSPSLSADAVWGVRRARSRTARTRVGMVDSLMNLGGAGSASPHLRPFDSSRHKGGGRSTSSGSNSSAPQHRLGVGLQTEELDPSSVDYEVDSSDDRSPKSSSKAKAKARPKAKPRAKAEARAAAKKVGKRRSISSIRFVDSDSASGVDTVDPDPDPYYLDAAVSDDGDEAGSRSKTTAASSSASSRQTGGERPASVGPDMASTRSGRASVPVHRLIDSAAAPRVVGKKRVRLSDREEEEDEYFPERNPKTGRRGKQQQQQQQEPPATTGKGAQMTLLYRVHSMTDPFAPDFWGQVAGGMSLQGGAALSADECQKMWFSSLEEARERQQKVADRKGQDAAAGVALSEEAATALNGKKGAQKRLAETAVIADKEDDIFDYNSTIAQLVAVGGERRAAAAATGVEDRAAVALLQFDAMASPASVHSEASASASNAIDAVGGSSGSSSSNTAWKVNYIQNLARKINATNPPSARNAAIDRQQTAARPLHRAIREGGVSAALDSRGNLRVEVREDAAADDSDYI